MFYSTDILSNKRYALSTVWRAGNTAAGARSTGIRRKAILEVNVQRACGTIKRPPGAPIALRLQATLLYGTARIYQEQCRYVLNDSERIQRAMHKLCNSLLDNKLDHNAGKTKNAQIVLPNDPSFDLDRLQLPPFDFDGMDDAAFLSQPRQASWTNLSLNSRSSNNTLLTQLDLGADSSGRQSFVGGFSFSASAAGSMQDSPTPFGRPLGFPEEDNLVVDAGLFIDENGNIVEEEPRSEPQLPSFPAFMTGANGPGAAKAGKLQPHGGDAAADEKAAGKFGPQPMIVDDDDDELVLPANLAVGPSVHPFDKAPNGSAAVAKNATPTSPQTSTSSVTLMSKQAHARKNVRHKAGFLDEITQIPLREYYSCVTDYAPNMERAAERKERASTLRRANDTARNRQAAYDSTFGRGLFGVADVLQTHQSDHPLVQMFSGDALAETFLGDALSRAKKRKLAAAPPDTPVGRRIHGGVDGFDDEQDIEMGRQPASALSDNPSLAWNNRHSSALPGSSVQGSVQRSVGGGGNGGGIGVMSSASRHSSPNFFERHSDMDDGLDLSMPLPSDAVNPFPSPLRDLAMGSADAPRQGGGGGDDDDKQSKLGEEMQNASAFLERVQKQAADEGLARPGFAMHRWVEFGDVVAPFRTCRPAVVGAFMSLLSLATQRQLCIQKDASENDVIDRAIFIGVKSTELVDKGKKTKKKRRFHEMSEGNSNHGDNKHTRSAVSGYPHADMLEVSSGHRGFRASRGLDLVGAA
ncbi:rad21 rec8 n terminal domain containing protein [Niveomyces insectorum RCEF 264]|uniref:Rad21 rec8 n terminal domain containing protein n=1 Tax=Niveomyces insectorum RCEF 264 TaxID=1081102 RepID=A0A167UKD1_9HYPO|nr:rad21 rec8 n terminal domain containing protein [Niveomyces insectorum RCEF 264]